MLLAVLLLVSFFSKPVLNADPVEIRKYGCLVEDIGGTWYTHIWALKDGDGEVDCTDELRKHAQDGRPLNDRCLAAEISQRSERKKALTDCDSWMKDFKKLLLTPKKSHK